MGATLGAKSDRTTTKKPAKARGLETRVDQHGRTTYRAVVRPTGSRQKVRSPWTRNIDEARAARRRLLVAQDTLGEELAAKAMPTVAEAADVFLGLAEEGRAWTRSGQVYAPETLRGYRRDFRLWIDPELGHIRIDRLRRSQAQGLVDHVATLRSGQRARNVVTALCALYRYLLPRYDDLQDPTHGLELPRGSAPRDVIATLDELRAMLGRLDGQDAAAFALAALAGLRAGELKGLQVEDVILDDHGHDMPDRIVVRAGWDHVEGRRALKHRREGEGREVPILRPLRPYVEGQLARIGGASGAFLPGKGAAGSRVGSGRPLCTNGLLDRARVAWGLTIEGHPVPGVEAVAPVGFRLHDARHTFASLLIVAGVDVATVALWVGHRQASTTLNRYVKPLRQRGVQPVRVRDLLGV